MYIYMYRYICIDVCIFVYVFVSQIKNLRINLLAKIDENFCEYRKSTTYYGHEVRTHAERRFHAALPHRSICAIVQPKNNIIFII